MDPFQRVRRSWQRMLYGERIVIDVFSRHCPPFFIFALLILPA
jgi:hypothetical protein